MSQLLNKAKEYLYENKKYFIIGAVLLVTAIIAYDVFSSGNIGNGFGQTREQLKSATNTNAGAGQALSESKRLTGEVRQANTNIQQSNNAIRSTIDESRAVNKSNAELIAECQSIIRKARSGK